MNVRIFIQNEAGSNLKHYHDQKTLEWKRVATVSARYPFPYGFIVGNLDRALSKDDLAPTQATPRRRAEMAQPSRP